MEDATINSGWSRSTQTCNLISVWLLALRGRPSERQLPTNHSSQEERTENTRCFSGCERLLCVAGLRRMDIGVISASCACFSRVSRVAFGSSVRGFCEIWGYVARRYLPAESNFPGGKKACSSLAEGKTERAGLAAGKTLWIEEKGTYRHTHNGNSDKRREKMNQRSEKTIRRI